MPREGDGAPPAPGPAPRPAQPAPESRSGFSPIRVLDVELGQPLPAVTPATAQDGTLYRRADALVRIHRRPLGNVQFDLDADGGLSPAALAEHVWRALGPEIRDHLARDGAAVVDALPGDGLGEGPCAEELPLPDPVPLASVVVATRDRPGQLVGSLDALVKLTYPRYELIVVDNAPSSGETAELIGRYASRYPQVRYVREDKPGLSNARNRGLREAKGDVVAYTDDDVVVDPGWLTALVCAFGAAPGVVGVTGLQVPAELETAAQAWFEAYCGVKFYRRELYDMGEHRPDDPLFPYTTGKFCGATMAFRTAALRELGGFDPALGAGTGTHGGEDLDMFFRILTSGGTAVVEPGAIIWHYNRRGYQALRRQVRGFGTGLTAMVTRQVLARPARVLELAAKLPAGLRFMFAADSNKNVTKDPDYPGELRRLELLGMLAGPLAYLRGRRRASGAARGDARGAASGDISSDVRGGPTR